MVVFLVLQANAAHAQVRHFIVGENPAIINPCLRCDSYVVPLSGAEDIAHAQFLIETAGEGGSAIVVAEIAAGSDGINRDHLSPGAPEWSWHVTRFLGFAEFVAEILDGTPSLVEADVEGWIPNTSGKIGFDTYTIVEELPEPSSTLMVVCAGATVVFLIRGGRLPRRGR